jgi:lysophospholipase L1-like esterase
MPLNRILPALAVLAAASSAFAQATPVLKFSFGPKAVPGHTQVKPTQVYTKESAFGYDLGSKVKVVDRGEADPLKSGFTTEDNGRGFFFSAKLAPGAYRVTVTLGDAKEAATTTVKSECRRLHLEALRTEAGQFETRSFLVHVRMPQIPQEFGGGTVRLKQRESDPILFVRWDLANKDPAAQIPFTELNWDEKLTLAFNDAKPALCSIEIAPAEKHTTVYLIGDSTMTDHMMEPFGAWGQMFPRFFNEPLLVANYAECGETTASFIGERRWAKIMSEISEGDYVFMQFGINDQSIAVDRFRQYFVQFIDEARAKKAIPVLVTSQNLKRLDASGKAVQTLRTHPDAMKEVAKEKNAPLIDLNEMSMRLYEAFGPGANGIDKAFADGTHHTDYGAYELAKCVVQGVIDQKLPIAAHVVKEWKTFDPAKPDAAASWKMPIDPQWDPAFDSPTRTSPSGNGPMAGAAPAGARGATPARGRGPATGSAPATSTGR